MIKHSHESLTSAVTRIFFHCFGTRHRHYEAIFEIICIDVYN